MMKPRTWPRGFALIVLGSVGWACAGSQTVGPGPRVHGEGAPIDIEASGMPWKALRGHGGQEVAPEVFLRELGDASLVCIGESHKNPHHHWAQLMLLGELQRAARAQGRELALGMEMFQRPFQGVIDDHRAGKIDEAALLVRTGWKERWGYDWRFYSPIVALALREGLPILALNAPGELTRKVARKGVAELTPDEKAQLPELVLDDEKHRAWFREATQGHGDTTNADPSFENFYTAQVIWDETMAETAGKWLAGGAGRQVVVLAGNGHCTDFAIPARVRRRGVAKAVSIQPILDDGSGQVADTLASPENDFLLVLDATVNASASSASRHNPAP